MSTGVFCGKGGFFFFFFGLLLFNVVALPDLAADLSFVLNVDDKGTGGKRVEVDDLDL